MMGKTLTAPVEAKALDCATSQRFTGGPFDGRRYHESLQMPPDAPEGSWVLSIPHGVDLPAGLIWRQVRLSQTEYPRPSQPASFVSYVNGKHGEWHYVPFSTER